MRMWTRPADRAPPYGPCGQAMEKLTLPHRLPTLGALAPTFSPLLQQRFMTKATAPAPAGSRIAPSSQAIRLRNTPANSRGDPTSESEKQHPERGPLGSGGCVRAEARTLGRIACEGKDAAEGWSKRGSQRGHGGVGLNSGGSTRKAPDRTDGCLMLEAVLWENPTYGISGGAAGNVAYGGTVNPPRNRKGGAGNPPPKGARASALPNDAM